ncbi:hypothetical protein JCGZ_21396 [Jatropha curcas]|uniref:TIR domain-containing protein n=1 Tax=Jatropha curcas TaxID=180498 RepID=A0A067JLN2_JATCU|nr:hypothetical protein JCGZ_21396 [Jatropha curcas]
MQRSSVTLTNIPRKVLQYNNYYRHLLLKNQVDAIKPPPPGTTCDIFISHRGIDTKRTIAGLLHYHLSRLGLRPFLDSKNMKPGDKLFDKIDSAILDSKLGLAVFSPRYCDSYFCLHELSLIMETKKRVIPIFCDVKPSELLVKDNGSCPAQDLQRFRDALHEAKYTVGLTFDTYKEYIF